MDGARWNDSRTQAGIVPVVFDNNGNTRPIVVRSLQVDDTVPGELTVVLNIEGGGSITLLCTDAAISIRSERASWGLCMTWGDAPDQPDFQAKDEGIYYSFNGHPYVVRIKGSSAIKIERSQPDALDEHLKDRAPTNVIELRPPNNELNLIMGN